MKFIRFAIVLFFGITLVNCGGDDDGSPQPNPNPENPPVTATYTATLTTVFTEEDFPQDYPDDASFGTIVVITHAPEIDIFSTGQMASAGLEAYIESGDVETFRSFISDQVGEQNEGLFVLSTDGTVEAAASKTIDLTVTPERTRITILANLSPSPDWFIGLDSFDIVDGNALITDETVSLNLLDGGTSTGDTYNASGTDENATISVLTGAPISDGPFSPEIASIRIQRTD